MDEYLIYTDSAADIPAHVYDQYDIRIVPMDYILNGKEITFDTKAPNRDQMCDELFAAQRAGADVHTSQITPFRYVETWRKDLEEGHDILYLSFSSGLSATWDNAVAASRELANDYPDRKIRVVDTLSATAGLGVLVYASCLNRAQGMSLEENAAWLEEHSIQMCHRFTVGDLDYLHKGGRVSAAVALIGGMLNIKPVMVIDDIGKLQVTSKCRGQNAAWKTLIREYIKERGVPGVPDVVYIGHSSLYEEAEKLKHLLQEAAGPDTIIETICETPIIGVHTGPEFFAVCGFGFHRKDD